LQEHPEEDFIIRIVVVREGDTVQYNLPTTDDLAMLIVEDFSLETFKRDIIIETRNKELKRIHPAYMALQYPLLFPCGERGFQVGVLYNGVTNRNSRERAKPTCQCKSTIVTNSTTDLNNQIHICATDSSQAKVDARPCIDENRLWYIMNN
jgi:hypothetical protein